MSLFSKQKPYEPEHQIYICGPNYMVEIIGNSLEKQRLHFFFLLKRRIFQASCIPTVLKYQNHLGYFVQIPVHEP